MTTLAASDTHALWQVAIGMGAVVLGAVIILMLLLLSLVKDIQVSVAVLLETAPIVASQTAALPQLAATPGVLDLIIEEAIVQDGYMDVLAEPYLAAGETI
jgi:hypothetical protein